MRRSKVLFFGAFKRVASFSGSENVFKHYVAQQASAARSGSSQLLTSGPDVPRSAGIFSHSPMQTRLEAVRADRKSSFSALPTSRIVLGQRNCFQAIRGTAG